MKDERKSRQVQVHESQVKEGHADIQQCPKSQRSNAKSGVKKSQICPLVTFVLLFLWHGKNKCILIIIKKTRVDKFFVV